MDKPHFALMLVGWTNIGHTNDRCTKLSYTLIKAETKGIGHGLDWDSQSWKKERKEQGELVESHFVTVGFKIFMIEKY